MRKCKDAGCSWRSVQTRRQAMSLRQGNLMPEACTFWRNDAALRRDSITTLYGWIEDYILFLLGTLISDLGSPDPLVRVEAPHPPGRPGGGCNKSHPIASIAHRRTKACTAPSAVACGFGGLSNQSRPDWCRDPSPHQRPEKPRRTPSGCCCGRIGGVGKARRTRTACLVQAAWGDCRSAARSTAAQSI